MSPAVSKHNLKVEGRQVDVTNLDRVLYPKTGFTKAQLIDYFVRIAPALLPHLRDRPLSLKRYPGGVDEPHFYQKEAPATRPSWLATALVPSKTRGASIRYCVANDLPSLVWLGNAADLELHTFLHTAQNLARPTQVMFDLDPGPGTDVVVCAQVALLLRDTLRDLGLRCLAKVSGGKGLQVHLPVNTPTTYDVVKPFARIVAERFAARFPDDLTANMRKELRHGRILIDWSQNDPHKTTVCAYSLRAEPTPTVAAPVTWDELAEAADSGDAASLRFSPDDVVLRVEESGDLMAEVLTLKQKLPLGDD